MSALRKLTLTYAGLLALLAITVGSSFLDLGGFNATINLAVAAAKAVLIGLMFMGLIGAGMLIRLTVFVAGCWLLILFGLTILGQ